MARPASLSLFPFNVIQTSRVARICGKPPGADSGFPGSTPLPLAECNRTESSGNQAEVLDLRDTLNLCHY